MAAFQQSDGAAKEGATLAAQPQNVEWIARLKAGDEGTWAEWFNDHGPRVWRYVARITGADSETVADLVQDVFLSASRGLSAFSLEKGALVSWILGIAHRKAARHWERVSRQVPPVDDWITARMRPAADHSGESAAMLGELVDAVRSAIASLSSESSALLMGRYLDEKNTDELAAEFCITEGAVRSRLSRARQKLREVLGEDIWTMDD